MSTTIATPRRSERLAAKAAVREAAVNRKIRREVEDREAAAMDEWVASQNPHTTDVDMVISTIEFHLREIGDGTQINARMISVCRLFNYCARQKAVLQRPRFTRFVEELHKKVAEMQCYRESTEESAPDLMAACDRVKTAFSS